MAAAFWELRSYAGSVATLLEVQNVSVAAGMSTSPSDSDALEGDVQGSSPALPLPTSLSSICKMGLLIACWHQRGVVRSPSLSICRALRTVPGTWQILINIGKTFEMYIISWMLVYIHITTCIIIYFIICYIITYIL